MVRITQTLLESGEQPLGIPILPYVLDATPEMMWQRTREEAAKDLIDITQGEERLEVCAWEGELLVGWASLMSDQDPNVGPCLSIHSFFVMPDFRGQAGKLMLAAILKFARANKHEVLGYSHRISAGRYHINYLRLTQPHKELLNE
jgi:GNAT superfamily N-acetyltransferase